MDFVTEGYVCLLACKLCHIMSVEECPEDLLTSNLDQYVQSLSSQIVNTIWRMIQTTEDLNRTARQDADSTFVYAKEDEMHRDGDDNEDDDDSDNDETDQASGNCMDKVVIHRSPHVI